MTSFRVVLALAVIAVTTPPTNAAPADSLAGLANARTGRSMRAGSNDPTGGNIDYRALGPGETLTLMEHEGAGVIRRFYIAFLPRYGVFGNPDRVFGGTPADVVAAHRQVILRMYWDDEAAPSVEAPIGDFFGLGFGLQTDFVSIPSSETTGGYSAYWPMPFHSSARLTLTNVSPSTQLTVWWNIDYTSHERLSPRMRHFHAQFRRENPTTPGQPYTILEATGAGHYVGTALFGQIRSLTTPLFLNFLFLEGDEEISIDGEAEPSIRGSGHEEYFNGGFYFDRGPAAGPFSGALVKDAQRGRVSAYRWHVEDPIPFRRSFKIQIEHGTGNEVEADYSSVAYWYQNEPHVPFPPLPEAEELLPLEPNP